MLPKIVLPNFTKVMRKKDISLPKIKQSQEIHRIRQENPCMDSIGSTNPKLRTHTVIILFQNLQACGFKSVSWTFILISNKNIYCWDHELRVTKTQSNVEIAVKTMKSDYHIRIIPFPVKKRHTDPWGNDQFWIWLKKCPRGVWNILFYLKARKLSKVVMAKTTQANLKGLSMARDGTILPAKGIKRSLTL